jgi:Carboxypeptidase regulatory-like domain
MPQTSGVVTGTVLSGPRCPGPESSSSPCPPEPVDGAAVVALRRGHIISSTRTDVRGGFRLTLSVGDYSIQATNIGGYRSTATRAVTVTASHPVAVTLLLDTGIR